MYHSFTDALIHTQAKTTLVQHLWPETLQAEYSLQHCQGDGVLFTGELAPADLLRIIPRLHTLTASMTRTLLRLVSEWGVSVRLTRHRGRYGVTAARGFQILRLLRIGGELLHILVRLLDHGSNLVVPGTDRTTQFAGGGQYSGQGAVRGAQLRHDLGSDRDTAVDVDRVGQSLDGRQHQAAHTGRK